MGIEVSVSTIDVRLEEIVYGARNINLYRFRSADGTRLPPAEPGAHIDLHINDKLVRSYSIITERENSDSYLIGVLSNPKGRGGSLAWHSDSRVGKRYRISKPRNNFPLAVGNHETYLFAGGIGVTPILSMYRHMLRLGQKPRLFYWAREPEDFLFADELGSDEAVHLLVTDLPGAEWPTIAAVIADLPKHAHLYCCGPNPMLAEFQAATSDWPSSHIHTERFAGEAIGQSSTTFNVTLAKSGLNLVVEPGWTILNACLAAGVNVDYSCEEGICGACETRVLAGEVQHFDTVKSPEVHDANNTMMICCSRPINGSVTLDL